VSDFNALHAKWCGRARIVAVYLREAHAINEWPMGHHVQVTQATTLVERAETAKRFITATGLSLDSVFVDAVEDKFMHMLSAHPQRFFVIDATGILRLKAAPFEGGYSLDDVDRCLSEVCAATSR